MAAGAQLPPTWGSARMVISWDPGWTGPNWVLPIFRPGSSPLTVRIVAPFSRTTYRTSVQCAGEESNSKSSLEPVWTDVKNAGSQKRSTTTHGWSITCVNNSLNTTEGVGSGVEVGVGSGVAVGVAVGAGVATERRTIARGPWRLHAATSRPTPSSDKDKIVSALLNFFRPPERRSLPAWDGAQARPRLGRRARILQQEHPTERSSPGRPLNHADGVPRRAALCPSDAVTWA